MKKYIKLILALIIMITINVEGATKNTSVKTNMSYNECIKFQESGKSGATNGYSAHCVEAKCPAGTWRTNYLFQKKNMRCANGNSDYYVKTEKTACSRYRGSCTPSLNTTYCGEVMYYDCGRKANGSIFHSPSKPPLTTKRPTTTKPSTTKPRTTKPATPRPTTPRPSITKPTEKTTKAKSNNNYIKDIKLENQNIEFKRKIYEYDIVAKKGIDIKFDVILDDEEATYEILNNLNVDMKVPITITVKAVNGDERVYVFNLVKEIEKEKVEKTTTKKIKPKLKLNNISIKGYKLKFDPDIYSYNLRIKENVDKLNINTSALTDTHDIEIVGNNNLKHGSKIYIKVTDEKNKTIKYVINIKKTGNIRNAIIIILIIVVIIYFLIKLLTKFKNRGKKLVVVGDSSYEYE